jgi:hypothetical protein
VRFKPRVGGEGSKGVGGGVSGDVTVETGGEGYVDNVLDGKGEGGGVWVRVRRREVVEEVEVTVVIVECVEERTCGENVVVDGDLERVERVEFGPCEDDVSYVKYNNKNTCTKSLGVSIQDGSTQ